MYVVRMYALCGFTKSCGEFWAAHGVTASVAATTANARARHIDEYSILLDDWTKMKFLCEMVR